MPGCAGLRISCRRIRWHFSGVGSVHLAQSFNRVHQVLTRRSRAEIEGLEERRRKASQLRAMGNDASERLFSSFGFVPKAD